MCLSFSFQVLGYYLRNITELWAALPHPMHSLKIDVASTITFILNMLISSLWKSVHLDIREISSNLQACTYRVDGDWKSNSYVTIPALSQF